MKTYRAQIIAYLPNGWTKDDMLASVLSSVSAVTVVDTARVMSLAAEGPEKINIVFSGLNDYEAAATAASAQGALPVSSDVLLDVKRGRKYHRVEQSFNDAERMSS
jgi:hypothetical protein